MTSLQLWIKVYWLPRLRFFIPGFVQRSITRGLGFAEVNTLVLCCEPDVTPQRLVTQTSSSNQCNGAEQKATKEPSRPVVAFVGSNVTGVKGAGQPNEKQREEEAHHQSVVATQR